VAKSIGVDFGYCRDRGQFPFDRESYGLILMIDLADYFYRVKLVKVSREGVDLFGCQRIQMLDDVRIFAHCPTMYIGAAMSPTKNGFMDHGNIPCYNGANLLRTAT